jgi:hypothetical protein
MMSGGWGQKVLSKPSADSFADFYFLLLHYRTFSTIAPLFLFVFLGVTKLLTTF